MAANPANISLEAVGATAPRRRKKPGPKPGSRHSGMFTRDDPRRHTGGPYPSKVKTAFLDKVRDLSDVAVDVLREVLEDPSAPTKERRAAAELVIAHGYGTPVNRVAVAQMDGTGSQAASLDLPALRRKASAVLGNKSFDGDVIDVGPDDLDPGR